MFANLKKYCFEQFGVCSLFEMECLIFYFLHYLVGWNIYKKKYLGYDKSWVWRVLRHAKHILGYIWHVIQQSKHIRGYIWMGGYVWPITLAWSANFSWHIVRFWRCCNIPNIGLTIPGNLSFEIRQISPMKSGRFHPEIQWISPMKSGGFHPDFTC